MEPTATTESLEAALRKEVTSCTERTMEWRSQRKVRVVRDPAEITRRPSDVARDNFIDAVNDAKSAIETFR